MRFNHVELPHIVRENHAVAAKKQQPEKVDDRFVATALQRSIALGQSTWIHQRRYTG